MIKITAGRGGAAFTVRVVPRASRNEIAGIQAGMVRIRLTAPPVEGAANRALVEFLAGVLGVAKRDVEIIAGHSSRQKVVSVSGLSPQEVNTRLQAHLPPL